MSKNEDLTTTNDTAQSNISDHGNFEKFVFQGLKSGGVHIVANKSHGKSHLMFSKAQQSYLEPNSNSMQKPIGGRVKR